MVDNLFPVLRVVKEFLPFPNDYAQALNQLKADRRRLLKRESDRRYCNRHPDRVKESKRKFSEKHKERLRVYHRNYYHDMNRKEYARNYYAQNRKTRTIGYLGAITCPKCGERGYGYLKRFENIKTGFVYSDSHVWVHHFHKEHGKTVYDKACYIGPVKELGDVKRLLSEGPTAQNVKL